MKRVKQVLEHFDIECRESIIWTLEKYMDEIFRLNEQVNLTAITDRDDFILKHYVDSLICAGSEEFMSAKRIIDVGTGAGFPGVPLAVVFPDRKFVLMDSLNKRIKIINELCSVLRITNVTAVHGRAEELARQKTMRESFDFCVSRAVANMSTLCEYCLPFVMTGGFFAAYKGPGSDEELGSAEHAIETLGGKLKKIEVPAISGFPFEHRIVYIFKEKETPNTYPRKAGIPSRRPL